MSKGRLCATLAVCQYPGHVVLTMTPETARITAERLLGASVEALASRDAGELEGRRA